MPNRSIKSNSLPQSAAIDLRALSAEELARRSKLGCHDSFAALVERFGARLLRFLRRRTNSLEDAEDLVQDTFVRAYANIRTYRSTYKFSTWLFTIARNLLCSKLRRRRPTAQLPQEAEAAVAGPREELARKQMTRSLWDAAATLTSNQYDALWFRYAEDMPIKEIARVMGKSQVGTKVTLCRARVKLAERLQSMAAMEIPGENPSSKETFAFMKVEGV